MWVIFAFGSAAFAGLTAILAKVGISKINSNLATALRTIVVLVFSWIMVWIVGSQTSLWEIESKTLVFLILSGIATGASWLCYFKALQIGDVNKVIPVDKSSTVLTMLLAFLFLREKISILGVVAMILIGVGTYGMIQKKEQTQEVSKGNRWLIYAVGSAVFASLNAILGKVGIEGIDSTLGTAIRTVVVLVMAWFIVFINGNHHEIKTIDKKSAIFLILSGVATGGSWLCYYRALQTGPVSIVVPIDKLSILFTVFLSYLFFKEKLNKKSTIGLILIVIGTLLLLI